MFLILFAMNTFASWDQWPDYLLYANAISILWPLLYLKITGIEYIKDIHDQYGVDYTHPLLGMKI